MSQKSFVLCIIIYILGLYNLTEARWQVDFQGDVNHLGFSGQTDPVDQGSPQTPPDVWNIFNVPALRQLNSNPYALNPSLVLLDNLGADTGVVLSLTGQGFGWAGDAYQESQPLQGDYVLLMNAFGVQGNPISWLIEGLQPNTYYELTFYHAAHGNAARTITFSSGGEEVTVSGVTHTGQLILASTADGEISGLANNNGATEGNWSGLVITAITPSAQNVAPYDGRENLDVSDGLQLRWLPSPGGPYTFNVYLGTDFANLPLVASELTTPACTVGNLDWDQTYYWRVDQVQGENVVPGKLWSFTTKVFACYDIGEADIIADCVVDMGDLVALAQEWLASGVADVDESGRVDFEDYQEVAQYWSQEGRQASNSLVAARLNDSALYERGQSFVYTGENLGYINMPVGGIGAGCLQMDGQGRRDVWQIFNNFSQAFIPDSFFAVRAQAQGQPAVVRAMQTEPVTPFSPMDSLSMIGEYPFARYSFTDTALPISVSMEAFSPMIPLNTRDSAIPCGIFQLTAVNNGATPANISFLAVQKNAAGFTGSTYEGPVHGPSSGVVYENFEDGVYSPWTRTGTAFGSSPSWGTGPGQQPVSGYLGSRLVNTFDPSGDGPVGTLTSPTFNISYDYVYFLIGGGNHIDSTYIRLVVNGSEVARATGKNVELLRWAVWPVADYRGQDAYIQIVDNSAYGWGHINIDHIVFSNEWVEAAEIEGVGQNVNTFVGKPHGVQLWMTTQKSSSDPSYGDMVLMTLEDNYSATASWSDTQALWTDFSADGILTSNTPSGPSSAGETYNGGIATPFVLAPGESKTVTFVLTWHFPNVTHGAGNWSFSGNRYNFWWSNARAVANYIYDNIDRLVDDTRLYHDTLYASNLPQYLLDRVSAVAAVMRSKTCFWSEAGYFGGWEGCHPDFGLGTGTCLHVWHYAQAHARLFPELAISLREQALHPDNLEPSGAIWNRLWSWDLPFTDAQLGEILNMYREHLNRPDGTWLAAHWPDIKRAMDYAITTWDADEDGLLTGAQWNTLDGPVGGATTWMGTLYCSALKACAKMAALQGDTTAHDHYLALSQLSAVNQNDALWRDDYGYYIQVPDPTPYEDYNTGCNIDQLLGVWWARQLDLDVDYSDHRIETALLTLLTHNYKDNFYGIPQYLRQFVHPDDPGTMMCTWPHGGRPNPHNRYADEVWTGTEYAYAANLIYHDLLTEGLLVVKSVADRYDGRLREMNDEGIWNITGNPFAENEWGNFYARTMSGWSVLLACQGFIYDGPAGVIGFTPHWRPDNHASFFTAAEGWGLFEQQVTPNAQTETITLKYGLLNLNTMVFSASAAPVAVTVTYNGQPVSSSFSWSNGRVVIELDGPLMAAKDDVVQVTLQ